MHANRRTVSFVFLFRFTYALIQNENVNATRADSQLFAAANRVIKFARQQDWPVVFTKVVFRPGYPEIAADTPNKIFSAVRARKEFLDGSIGAAIADAVFPQAG